MLAVLSMANTDNYGCELGVRGRGGGVHGRSVSEWYHESCSWAGALLWELRARASMI